MKATKKTRNLIVGLALVAVVGGTLAYFNQTMDIKNQLGTKKYGSEVVETFTPKDDWQPGATVNKDVAVENTGDYDIIARVTWDEEWTRNGETTSYEKNSLAEVMNQTKQSVVTKNLDDTANWIYGGDGYYYYLQTIKKNEKSTKWLDSITLNSDANMGKIVKTTYYTEATTEPDKTNIGTDVKTQWVKVDSTTVPKGATFVRRVAEIDPQDKGYSDSKYTLQITAEVLQATPEAVATWTSSPTVDTVKTFLASIK